MVAITDRDKNLTPKIYQSKGNSDTTAAAVIPKNGDELQAKVDK